ncbi:hypothetical protein R6Q57_009387 [Mikania cordata]
MGARIPAHQLSNGLYISVRPNQNTQPHPTIGSETIPSTGGDPNDSSKTGKVISEHRNYDSGPISKLSPGSGPIAALQPTGLITSGNIESGRVDVLMVSSCIGIWKTIYGPSERCW